MDVTTERMSVPIKSRFELIKKMNDEFTLCKAYVMALGKNRNGSHFSRESVEEALPSLCNIPIVAFLYEDEDGNKHVGGHEGEYVEKDGSLTWRSKCIPYGTVPDGDFAFEEVVEPNGTKATYLTANVILWTGRYPEILDAVYSNDYYYNHSMEVKVIKAEKLNIDQRYYDISKFSFSALCMLGKSDNEDFNVEPCFPSSSIIPFSFDEQFSNSMEQFKTALADCFANINSENNGGEDELELDNNQVVETENIETVEEVVDVDQQPQDEHFEVESVIEEDNVGTIESTVINDTDVDNAHIETNEDFSENENTEPENAVFVSTYGMKSSAISTALRAMCVNDKENEHYVWYYLCDFDEMYAYITIDETKNNDTSFMHGRATYVYSEVDNTADITGEIEEMYLRWLTKEDLEKLEKERDEFDAYKANHSASNEEVEELRSFKQERLAEDHRIEIEEALTQFEDLVGNFDFEELRTNALNYTVEDLEEKCFAIRGRAAKVSFSKKPIKEMRIPIVDKVENDAANSEELYGGIFAKYGYGKKD